MQYKILEAEHDGQKFRIEEDYPNVGAYLYVYKNENCVQDFLQNSISACREVALEEYGVALDKWQEIENKK